VAFLDDLRTAPLTYEAKLNTFLIEFRPRGDVVFLFVEGKADEVYYHSAVRRFSAQRGAFRSVTCGSKRDVLQTLSWYLSRFSPNSRALFFVDRDHDCLVGTPAPSVTTLFVTEGYSIESSLCSPPVVRRVLTEHWGVDGGDPVIERIVAQYMKGVDVYAEKMRAVMEIAIASRLAGLHPRLSGLVTDRIVRLDEDLTPQLKIAGAALESHTARSFGVTPPLSSFRQEAARLMGCHSRHVWLRGKQALWFLLEYLEGCNKSLRKKSYISKATPRLSRNSCLSVLSPLVSFSPSLQSFMSRHLAEVYGG